MKTIMRTAHGELRLPAWAEECGRRVALDMAAGLRERAVATIEHYWEQNHSGRMSPPESLAERLEAPLESLGLSGRIVNTLEWHGILTVGDLAARPRAGVAVLNQIGVGAINQIAAALASWGIDWK